MPSSSEKKCETGIDYFTNLLRKLDEEYHLSKDELTMVCLILSEVIKAVSDGKESTLEELMPSWQRAFNAVH